ncbi:MAG TPA: GxxExxY protein [Gemmatimonadaceae bacterium]
MNTEEHGHRDPLSRQVIGAFYEVYRELGIGFLEAVYCRALAITLSEKGLVVESEARIPVFFKGEAVGDYRADLLVERRLLVEVKAVDSPASVHRAQLLNYLRATTVEVGLLVNFGAKFTFERLLFTNDRKR